MDAAYKELLNYGVLGAFAIACGLGIGWLVREIWFWGFREKNPAIKDDRGGRVNAFLDKIEETQDQIADTCRIIQDQHGQALTVLAELKGRTPCKYPGGNSQPGDSGVIR